MSEAFDYVIVGGGTAGCILANRLSADPKRTVCLIEAGSPGKSWLISMPMGVMWLMKHPRWNWNFRTEPQAALNGREIIVPRGRALGGSSAINGMVYIRGLPSDFDGWAAAGCTGWGFDAVLPHFRKSERNGRLGAPYHGTEGEMPISDLARPHPVVGRFIEAAANLQLPETDDFSGARPEGFGRYQSYTENGRRVTAANAFLEPVMSRPNLKVMSDLSVRRLVVDGGRVTGVDTSRGTVRARGEVVLTAGAIGSPHLLLLSGIGPAAHLREKGVDVVRDVPGVGANFHDHPNVMLMDKARGRHGYGLSLGALPALARSIPDYLMGRGMWASNVCEGGGFARVDPGATDPDVQFHFVPFWRSTVPGKIYAWGHGYALHVCKLRPESRGTVRLRSANAAEAPAIDPAMLTAEADMETMVRGVKLARRILSAPPLADVRAREALPGEAVRTDDEIRAWLRERTATVFHPVGSCRMGVDEGAVVDPQLRFRGLDGLRIADASIMPRIVSGNTNAAAMMIAEKAADMIRAA